MTRDWKLASGTIGTSSGDYAGLGAMIQGGLTPDVARRTAAILKTGPLPAALSNPAG